MCATQYTNIVDVGNLGAVLENMIDVYRKSTGSASGGVPAELIQAASRMDPRNATLNLKGPADAVAPDEEVGPPDFDASAAAALSRDNATGLPQGEHQRTRVRL